MTDWNAIAYEGIHYMMIGFRDGRKDTSELHAIMAEIAEETGVDVSRLYCALEDICEQYPEVTLQF